MGSAVQVVPEILSTGGAFAHIDLSQTSQGYLTPQDFHEALLHRCVSAPFQAAYLGGREVHASTHLILNVNPAANILKIEV